MAISSINDLRLQGLAACLCQCVAGVGLSVVLWFKVFKPASVLFFLAYTTWGASAFLMLLGVLGFVSKVSLILGLHCIFAVSIAGGLGGLHVSTLHTFLMQCSEAQSSSLGCNTCACAVAGTCTQELLSSEDACSACQALGTEICSDINSYSFQVMLLCMGLSICAPIAVPAVYSLRILIRLDSDMANVSNRLLYARAVIAQDLSKLQRDTQHLLVSSESRELSSWKLTSELLLTLMAYGGSDDKALFAAYCRAVKVDAFSLA
ncbi:hypothetical protein CEUSTIGMA_g10203.t1 [Chlamydomonas eustigma]|uniref:Uncharacterized protein n=1 Tax=Chlamydomonas eustigma TaxID=1157962 RepID=A0A250XI61_9CHLO|nr:hypothetical protein CEUSTIGMA_g10203.t1 [Chlamydomonas eustigma]|eukprot:GAX82777.1 hypothetical protein CEUSTIGMA_g10203.t1 [Chlamydomonas eustigma]